MSDDDLIKRLRHTRLTTWEAIIPLVAEAADRIEELEAFINTIDIGIMHLDMGGNHQCKVGANGRTLTGNQWRIIHTCRPCVPMTPLEVWGTCCPADPECSHSFMDEVELRRHLETPMSEQQRRALGDNDE